MTPEEHSEQLRRLLPPKMRAALAEHRDDPEFVAECVRAYLEGSDETRADIEAFHESDGPGMIERAAGGGEA